MFHLLAYAMTQPGLDPRPLIAVLGFMQGSGLALLASAAPQRHEGRRSR